MVRVESKKALLKEKELAVLSDRKMEENNIENNGEKGKEEDEEDKRDK